MQILFLKAHNKGYTKKDGTYVAPFDDKRVAGKLEQIKGYLKKPSKFDDLDAKMGGQGSLFGGGFGGKIKSAGVVHPRVDDDGKKVIIHSPSVATHESTWTDPHEIADFVPGSKVPKALNGVAFSSWDDHPKTDEGWDYVEGQMDDLDEPGMKLPHGMAPAAGVVIEEPDGRVWVVRPTNAFAGYKATFPKGHADEGMSLQATAIKECFEESGLKVEITGFLQDVVRTQTVTRYYRARRVGGTPADMGWETQAVSLIPKADLIDTLNRSVDHAVGKQIGGVSSAERIDSWKQVGKQAGSNPGGAFTAPDGARWYCKFPSNPAIAKNEVLASKLYAAAGIRVPEVKLVSDNGKVGVASRMIDGLKASKDRLADAPGARDGFAVDAWLANWDVVGLGYDNLLLDKSGQAVRIDTGGALSYRAQGGLKGAAFGDKVTELETFRNGMNPQAATVFGDISDDEIRAGVERVASVSADTIRHLVDDFGPGGRVAKDELVRKLLARQKYLKGLYL